MALLRLEIAHLRNLQSVSLPLHPHFNLISGPNGSGKTSILEAIYLLGMGRSFRSGRVRRLINDNSTFCTVFAGFVGGGQAGIRRLVNGEMELRLDGRSHITLAEVAQRLPMVLLDPQGFSVLSEGSKPRRALLDWGVFHVEHAFYPVWQRYQRALKQRNSLLRSGTIRALEVRAWDKELAEAATQLHALRSSYMAQWLPFWSTLNQAFLPNLKLNLEYSPGWDTALSLDELLADSWAKDQERGFTQSGPHRADLRLKLEGAPADEVLSRGQNKLAISALRLSQVSMLEERGMDCVLLIDDLPSELDSDARRRLMRYLGRSNAQCFVTTIEPDSLTLPLDTARQGYVVFHVEHGAVKEVQERALKASS